MPTKTGRGYAGSSDSSRIELAVFDPSNGQQVMTLQIRSQPPSFSSDHSFSDPSHTGDLVVSAADCSAIAAVIANQSDGASTTLTTEPPLPPNNVQYFQCESVAVVW